MAQTFQAMRDHDDGRTRRGLQQPLQKRVRAVHIDAAECSCRHVTLYPSSVGFAAR